MSFLPFWKGCILGKLFDTSTLEYCILVICMYLVSCFLLSLPLQIPHYIHFILQPWPCPLWKWHYYQWWWDPHQLRILNSLTKMVPYHEPRWWQEISSTYCHYHLSLLPLLRNIIAVHSTSPLFWFLSRIFCKISTTWIKHNLVCSKNKSHKRSRFLITNDTMYTYF